MEKRRIEIWVKGSTVSYSFYDELENAKKYLTITDYDIDRGYIIVSSDFIEKAFKEIVKFGVRFNTDNVDFERAV